MNSNPLAVLQARRNSLLTDVQAAERLGLAVKTLRNWRVSGRGPRFIRLGRAVRYAVADLDAFIESGRRSSTSDRAA